MGIRTELASDGIRCHHCGRSLAGAPISRHEEKRLIVDGFDRGWYDCLVARASCRCGCSDTDMVYMASPVTAYTRRMETRGPIPRPRRSGPFRAAPTLDRR